MEPAREVGGDLYDFFMLDERRLFFSIGDVAGKGLSASIFMAVSKALYKSTTLRRRDATIDWLMRTANEEVARGFEPGTHAATFGGNPLATAGALYVQQAIDRENLLERCRDVGSHLGSALLRLAERRRPRTRGARGRGLLQGLVMDGDAAPVVAKARDAGLLVSVAGGNVIRFAPALIVSKAQIDEAIAILDDVLAQVR